MAWVIEINRFMRCVDLYRRHHAGTHVLDGDHHHSTCFPFRSYFKLILDCSFQTIFISQKTFTNCRQSPVSSRHPFDWRRRQRQRRAALLLPSATAVLGPQCGSLRGAKAGRALWGNGVEGALRVEIDCKHLERVEMFEFDYCTWMLFDLIIVHLGWNLQVSSSWGRPVHMEMTVGKLKMDTEVTRLAQCWWSHLARVVAASEVEMVEWHARHEVMPAEMGGSDWLVNHRMGQTSGDSQKPTVRLSPWTSIQKTDHGKLKQDEFGNVWKIKKQKSQEVKCIRNGLFRVQVCSWKWPILLKIARSLCDDGRAITTIYIIYLYIYIYRWAINQ